MPWWGLWWVVSSWPGQQSAEVSSPPWAPGWARWSAVGWAWPWADPRTGLIRTCHSLRGSWVSSYPQCGKHNQSIKTRGGDEPICLLLRYRQVCFWQLDQMKLKRGCSRNKLIKGNEWPEFCHTWLWISRLAFLPFFQWLKRYRIIIPN